MKNHLKNIATISKDFMKEIGGMSNGYLTEINGTLAINMRGSISLFTPKCEDLTYNQVKKLGRDLEKLLHKYMEENKLKGVEFKFKSSHMEYGCFKINISYTIQERISIL